MAGARDADGMLAGSLGPVEGAISGLDQRIRVHHLRRVQARDPHAEPGVDLGEQSGQLFAKPLSDSFRKDERPPLVGVRKKNNEFVAAESRGIVRRAEFAGDGRRRQADDFVADVVSEVIIDRLAVGDVYHKA